MGWQLHVQTGKLLLKADSAVALKASLGLLIVLRFCWTSWVMLSSQRCSLAEQGQLQKLQGARHLLSTLRGAVASRLHCWARHVSRKQRHGHAMEARWRDFHHSWISNRARRMTNAMTSPGAADALEVSAMAQLRPWLCLLLRAWRATRGRALRRLRHGFAAASTWRCGMKSVLHLRLQVQKSRQSRWGQRQGIEAGLASP
eukprot:Skav229965  [mRNA]  locus=scaffold327:341360:347686:- [translate_table: standard]